MKRILHIVMLCLAVTVLVAAPCAAFAQEAINQQHAQELANEVSQEHSDSVTSATDTASETVSSLTEDLKQARDLLLGKSGDNPFSRGMLIALFQPMFLASMFCLGLWAGQMSEKITHIWVLPVFAFAATLVGAFIATYHSDWKPDFTAHENMKFLSNLESTDTVAVVVGLVIGAVVTMQLVVLPIFAVLGIAAAGLILGFSQTADLGAHHNSAIPFWAGFGLTGLLINIFGIGFETFLQSIKLQMVTRLVGAATAVLSFFFAAKIF